MDFRWRLSIFFIPLVHRSTTQTSVSAFAFPRFIILPFSSLTLLLFCFYLPQAAPASRETPTRAFIYTRRSWIFQAAARPVLSSLASYYTVPHGRKWQRNRAHNVRAGPVARGKILSPETKPYNTRRPAR